MNLIKKQSNFLPFVFDDFFRNTWDILPTKSTNNPATNVIENDKEFILEFSIPGKDNLDFKVELDNRILSLSLKKSDSVSHDNYMLQQFNFSSFNGKAKTKPIINIRMMGDCNLIRLHKCNTINFDFGIQG